MLKFDMNKTIDVIALGRAGIDLNAIELNVPMEENMTFRKTVGGSPANIAIACSQYGLSVGFIGRVSDDQHGRYIKGVFEKKGINTDCLIPDEEGGNNGLAFTEIRSPVSSSFILHRDNVADLNLNINDINEKYIEKARLLVVSGTALSRSPSREAVFAALEYAQRHDTKVLLDLDYRDYTWSSAEECGIYLSLASEKCNYIIGTREEFDVLESLTIQKESDDSLTAKKWIDSGAEAIVVKHGKKGAVAYTAEGQIIKGAVFPVIPLKTMGAGDSYAGGFIYGLLSGMPIEQGMEIGAAAAAIVVQKPDCSESMPTLSEVHEFISVYRGES